MRVVGRTLLITESAYGDTDPHCCPSFEEAATYEWRGSSFVEISRRRSPVNRKGSGSLDKLESSPPYELTEQQRREAFAILNDLKEATNIVELSGSLADYKLAVDVASYYERNVSALPEGKIKGLLLQIYLSHYDALLVWGLYNGLDSGPMFSMAEFRRNLAKRYGIRTPISRGNRQARDQALKTIWRIQVNLEQRAANLLS